MTKDDLVSKDTALKMAIERLEIVQLGFGNTQHIINACKEALEQPSWQELTGDEITRLYVTLRNGSDHKDFARAIEQELKTKNGFSGLKDKNS
jgi:actin-like ATPase involved in cell morphogenesis